MILLSFSQVVMRNLFSSGWIWAGDVLRAEVIWITFIGAALATEYKSHVRIDILSRLVRQKSAVRVFDMLADLFTAGVSVLLFVAAVQYVILMKPYSTDIMTPGIEEWMIRLVIPYAFAAMATRCAVFVIQALINTDDPDETQQPLPDE
jgi:TRAP-type C4-dicarboxylate transport system permease small subunit